MRSILISLGNFQLHSFGLCVALGLLGSYIVISRLGRRENLSPDFAANIVTAMIVSGIIGARLFYVGEHWAYYSAHPAEIPMIWKGGLMFYGGFIVAFGTALVYIKLAKLRLWAVLDILAVALPLAHAFGRIGCFLNGCCYGRVAADSAISIRFPAGSIPWTEHVNEGLISLIAPHSLPVLPSQLISAALNFAIFAVLLLIALRGKPRPGLQSGLYMVLYATARFSVEFTRADERFHFGAISISQTISLGIFAIGAAVLICAILRVRAAGQSAAPAQ